MKKVFYVMLAVLLASTVSMNAQVRIGNTTDPHAGAVLDLKSTETTGKGVLFPSVNLADVNIFQLGGNAAAAEGMIIYNTNAAIGKGIYYWDGAKWHRVNDMSENPADLILTGTPADWVTVDPAPNAGEGTESNPYLNTCPGTTVVLAPQSGYTFGTVEPEGAASPYLSGLLKFTTSGKVSINKGSQSGTVYVTINTCAVPVTGVSLTPTTATLTAINQTQQLTATVAPTNATNKAVTWTSSNTAVATVDANGLVTAKASGSTTITVKTTDGNKTATSTITINIPVPVTGVSVTPTTATLTAVNQTQQLTATVAPTNATNKAVTWTSSNTAVATVDANGLVTAKAAGTATITVKTTDGSKTATSTITVRIPVTGVTLTPTTATLTAVNQTQQLTATVAPTNATNKAVTWTSSNTAVATVSSTGLVTAKAAGTATITVKTTDGSKIATSAITVSTDGSTPMQIGNNTYKTYTYSGKIWMVENSKEGTPSGTVHTNSGGVVNGYYYTWAQASGACPSGWHLPTQAEWESLKTWVNANKSHAGAQWWVTAKGNAFAGFYNGSSWYSWGTSGCWWSAGASSQDYDASTGGMYGPYTNAGGWFSVRCVKN